MGRCAMSWFASVRSELRLMSRGNAYPVRNKLSYNQGNPTNGGGTSIVFPGAPVVQVNQRSDFVIPTSHVTSSTKSLVGESPLYTLAPEELKAINSNTRPRDQLQARKKGPKTFFSTLRATLT